MKVLKLKICGLRDNNNIRDVVSLDPDYIGFIFYPGSPRYVGEQIDSSLISAISPSIIKVGVLVDEPLGSAGKIAALNRLDMVQLHGNESPQYCANLKRRQIGIIKSFSVGYGFSFSELNPYLEIVDYFLFDAKGILRGGSGETFDWRILNDYPFTVPFFLSGGVSLSNIEQLLKIHSKYLYAVDVNSRFETAPAMKDIEKLKSLQEKLKYLKLKRS